MTKPFPDVVLALVREDGPDLSLRQCAALVAVVQCPPGQRQDRATVRFLADQLRVSKPAITRAFDRLEELRYGDRVVDPGDRRSVWFRPSPAGVAMAKRMGAEVAS